MRSRHDPPLTMLILSHFRPNADRMTDHACLLVDLHAPFIFVVIIFVVVVVVAVDEPSRGHAAGSEAGGWYPGGSSGLRS